MKSEIKSFEGLSYVIRYPREYRPEGKMPVLLFLHGAGTRGNDIEKLITNPFFTITNNMDLPFITVAPLCHANTWFDLFETLSALTAHIHSSDFADQNRFYAMGASMGGYAVWQLAMSHPELFTAIIPICGGGMYWNAARLKSIPVWAFHGMDDPTVKVEESRKMVDAVNQKGGNAKLTVYENCRHDAWSETYANREVYEWLLSQCQQNAVEQANLFDNSEKYG